MAMLALVFVLGFLGGYALRWYMMRRNIGG